MIAAPAGMVLISAKNQSFLMGMDKSDMYSGEPVNGWAFYVGKHKVTFTYDFYLDTAMVTQGDFQGLMGFNPAGHNTGDKTLPVEKTTWYDAVLYCNAKSKRDKLDTVYTYARVVRNGANASDLPGLAFNIRKDGYRIPTTAEYEYAERAGTTGKHFFAPDGKNVDALGAQFAWWTGNSGNTTHPVATKKPNPWGLYDMVGNLFEWCNDWNAPYPTTDVVDPVGAASSPEGNKVAKGGSFKTDIAGHMRIQYHYKWNPNSLATQPSGVGEIGFRTARTLTAATSIKASERKAGLRPILRGHGGGSEIVGFTVPGTDLPELRVDAGGRRMRIRLKQ